ncbi:helix-turn-helix domain-containing protein [Ornithinimicrobium sufpigmenti]|uniref:helix-turn-helix domain-containing protein n=1 Tax=Ornithinimicrobium sufpigmenti TaxID=2508882 RepID=UPI001EE02EC3|nr:MULTISPECIES: helix-turn-helix domain-containing protein [unclassified Ornithinimicrobium]
MSRQAPYHSRALHPALSPYLTALVGYDVVMGAPGVHRGLPSTSLTLTLPLRDPLDVSWSDDPSSRVSRWSVVSGLHAAPASIHHDGHQAGIQVGLTPAGARALLGIPAAALRQQLAGLDELDAREVTGLRHLPERLHECDDWPERLRLTHDLLLSALSRGTAPGARPEVTQALDRLARGRSVASVAEEVGWSRRHLGAQVHAELGLGPKTYQRVARFQAAQHRLARAARHGRPALATLAVDAGYADQAHLTREWVTLAGCTAVQWLAEEFPFLQDSPALREQTDAY